MSEQEFLTAFRRAVMRRMGSSNMNLRSLAAVCGVSIGCLSEALGGKAIPQLRTVLLVCKALEISFSELEGGSAGA